MAVFKSMPKILVLKLQALTHFSDGFGWAISLFGNAPYTAAILVIKDMLGYIIVTAQVDGGAAKKWHRAVI